MTKFILICCLLVIGLIVYSLGNPTSEISETEALKLFDEFILEYNKIYESQGEYLKRFGFFKESLKRVREQQKKERGTAQYGITKFSDLSAAEFGQRLGLRKKKKIVLGKVCQGSTTSNHSIPENFDWRDHGAVSVVKNQENCKASWAFSVVGAVEGAWAATWKNLISLSEQELVDCAGIQLRCDLKGDTSVGFDAIADLGGLESEEDYPYKGYIQNCSMDPSKIKVKIAGSVQIKPCESCMAENLYLYGPLSAVMNSDPLPDYKEGILHPSYCSPLYLDLAVTIVGYGVEKSKETGEDIPYWIIKNSWGVDWGEKGYFRLYRGEAACGINLNARSVRF